MMNYQKFNTIFFSITAFLLLLVVSINFVVDPFEIYYSNPTGWSPKKLFSNKKAPLHKAVAIQKEQPEILILGNSRAEFGYDPQHPGFRGRKAYNASLSGASLPEMEAMLRYAIHVSQIKEVLLSIDAGMFWQEPQNWQKYTFLPSNDDREYQGFVLPHRELLLSLRTFEYSVRTIVHQDRLPQLNHYGMRDPIYYADKKKNLKPWDSFQSYLTGMNKNLNLSAYQLAQFQDPVQLQKMIPYQSFVRILELLNQHQIKTNIVIAPIHAYYYATMEEHGLWPAYLSWLNTLAATVLEKPQTLFSLWDSSGFHQISSELIPSKDHVGPMAWYWEASHFRWETGQEVLKKVLLDKPSQIPVSKLDSFEALANQIKSHENRKSTFYTPKLQAQFKDLLPKSSHYQNKKRENMD